MPFFSKFKSKGSAPAPKKPVDAASSLPAAPQKPRWQSQWSSKEVVPEEVQELVHTCTAEMKKRAEALDAPFLLLPFRPDSDPSAARTFIRNFFKGNAEGSSQYRGAGLQQELRLTEPIVLCSIMKWCWSRMPGGVVTWPVYEGFKLGEEDSNMARNAFEAFIPIGAASEARTRIIFDFFDLLAAIAAHGKTNGLGGRKLSRLAGWWAFEHSDDGKGFEGGYKSWATAADASSHLFFAYLRSLSPDASQAITGISKLPRSLQALQAQTEYPPETPTLMQTLTPKVVMIVDSVSPTPFALLRRAKHFEYRDEDRVLQKYSEFEDPVQALTEECKRVLYAVSSTNVSAKARSRHGNLAVKPDESWSAFQDMGFSDLSESTITGQKTNGVNGSAARQGLRAAPRSRNADHGRPTTPSWADFLSSGFVDDDENKAPAALLLPPDKVLPPIGSRAPSSQSTARGGEDHLEPGELASITNVDLDDTFWWVWMTSLAGEEPTERKSVFGRCALIETNIMGGRWLVMEEQVKGASPGPEEGAYIAEKKSRFGFSKRTRLGRKRTTENKHVQPPAQEPIARTTSATPSKSSIAPAQQEKIRAAAAALKRQEEQAGHDTARRGRYDDATSTKTNSVMTLGLQTEASPAMKWASAYDKNAVRKQYLGDNFAGTGRSREFLASNASLFNDAGSSMTQVPAPAPATEPESAPLSPKLPREATNKDLPAMPQEEERVAESTPAPEEPQSPLPAPLPPKALNVTVEPVDTETQAVAEQVPLPQTTTAEDYDPTEKETARTSVPTSPTTGKVGRKPVPRKSDIQNHPAYRRYEELEAAAPRSNPAQIAAQRAMESKASSSSPESLKNEQAPQQAKKGGFKQFFGRKRENPNRRSFQSAPQAPPRESSLQAPLESNNIGRRISFRRNKPSPVSTPQENPVGMPAVPASPAGPMEAASPTSVAYNEPTMDMSRVNTEEAEDAQHAFQRFDQGPLMDAPAFTPRDSVDDMSEADETPSAPRFQTRAAALLHPEPASQRESEDFTTPAEHEIVQDEASEANEPVAYQPSGFPSDRWAQIRENAARRAARASEEHSTQSRPSRTAETDDGETSGEETIESRVARIKARVAELTGNMETTNSAARR